MVYVISKQGQLLMPTERHRKVRIWLNNGQAKVVQRSPFTIQLLFDTGSVTQPITLGVDAGSKHIGLSATTEGKVLYEADVETRNDVVELLSIRRQNRRARRSRKKRYRAPRFQNRIKAKKEGWLAPSIKQKIQTHLHMVDQVKKILPISNIIVEVASFDIQKINHPKIQGVEYQQGEQLDFWNVREYVLFRDGHTCQCCKGTSKDQILNVHHIESRQVGGDAPNNLITLCETCHKGFHNGTVQLPKSIHRGMTFKDAAFMGIMRHFFYNSLKQKYENVTKTYGYMTKNTRIESGLPKDHTVDARCISGNANATPLGYHFTIKKMRCHNRQIHKNTILKGGTRKRNQADYKIYGFALFDRVRYQGQEYFIYGRRSSGFFDIRTLDGTKVNNGSISYKKLTLLERNNSYLVERTVG